MKRIKWEIMEICTVLPSGSLICNHVKEHLNQSGVWSEIEAADKLQCECNLHFTAKTQRVALENDTIPQAVINLFHLQGGLSRWRAPSSPHQMNTATTDTSGIRCYDTVWNKKTHTCRVGWGHGRRAAGLRWQRLRLSTCALFAAQRRHLIYCLIIQEQSTPAWDPTGTPQPYARLFAPRSVAWDNERIPARLLCLGSAGPHSGYAPRTWLIKRPHREDL